MFILGLTFLNIEKCNDCVWTLGPWRPCEIGKKTHWTVWCTSSDAPRSFDLDDRTHVEMYITKDDDMFWMVWIQPIDWVYDYTYLHVYLFGRHLHTLGAVKPHPRYYRTKYSYLLYFCSIKRFNLHTKTYFISLVTTIF